MKRKIMALVMAVTMAAGLMGCGSNADAPASVETEQAAGGGQEADVEAEAPGAAEAQQENTDSATDGETDPKEETKSAIEKAQAERDAATIKDVEIAAKDIPDNEALAFVANMKAGWNLGNSLEAHNSGSTPKDELSTEEVWGNPVTTQAMIDEVKKAGFETIRIPITWRGHVTVSEDGTVTVSEVWLARVKEVVDYAFNNDMYVIINTHHDIDLENGYYPNSDHYERSAKYLTAIWTAMAETFKDYDDHLIFESLNEPRLVGSSYEWNFQAGVAECKDAADSINRLNQLFVDTVRATGGNNAERYLMMPGYAASIDGAMTDLYQLPTDSAENKLIVSVHAYTPYNFALQPPQEGGSTDEFSIEKSASTADIDSLMKRLYDKYISQGIPVVIGEYGARDKNNNLQDRLDYYVYYVSSARAAGITCCVWDNNAFSGTGENFGLFRRRVCNWLYPEIIEAIMKYA
ncbi:MAG: glycoside hydrolase family 5 protein [Lachnospiraceae bacterium]|nr:glycoside hydrolase family 5 protein [Lachnospiraceae bacterium]